MLDTMTRHLVNAGDTVAHAAGELDDDEVVVARLDLAAGSAGPGGGRR